MRYFWSPRAAAFAAAAVLFVCATAHGCKIDAFADPQTLQLQHGRHLTAFEVEAQGGPVSQNCSAAPWRVRNCLRRL